MTKQVLLIRAEGNEADSQALSSLGLESTIDPYLTIRASTDREAHLLLDSVRTLSDPLWLIATSAHALRYWANLVGRANLIDALTSRGSLRFAAVGASTALAMKEFGAKEVLLPNTSDSVSLAQMLKGFPVANAMLPQGNIALVTLAAELVDAGWYVQKATVYETATVDEEPSTAGSLRDGGFSAVILRSPSAARALARFAPKPKAVLICIGATTAHEVEQLGLQVGVIAESPTPAAVAQAAKIILKGLGE